MVFEDCGGAGDGVGFFGQEAGGFVVGLLEVRYRHRWYCGRTHFGMARGPFFLWHGVAIVVDWVSALVVCWVESVIDDVCRCVSGLEMRNDRDRACPLLRTSWNSRLGPFCVPWVGQSRNRLPQSSAVRIAYHLSFARPGTQSACVCSFLVGGLLTLLGHCPCDPPCLRGVARVPSEVLVSEFGSQAMRTIKSVVTRCQSGDFFDVYLNVVQNKTCEVC